MEDSIVMDPAACNGRPTVRGTRIAAQTVLEFLDGTMKSKPAPIDLDKLRARIRQLGLEQDFLMLDEALEMLPQPQLHRLAKQQIHRSFTQSGATSHRGRGTGGTTGKMPFGERSRLV